MNTEQPEYHDWVKEQAHVGRTVAEILGTELHSFDPGFTFGQTGTLLGDMHLPKHVVEKIYSMHLELQRLKATTYNQ